ncbi:hypothetical protein U732_127 [Clostridium argentinense CDC 2741]|uniref:Uncharacterized protein n=2 Tax=Clostridium argentinense TaxID=29341 RepID=A0A0C1UBG8_9CLOT|nr:hypothetical protein [Clostridium argentinense]ARC83142.1 hypothetical protein RSJ17_00380 [Clostridium argentinense]KIE44905.1 hypothetical protein U732_127 [Clostridium argentinense CDC 2741]NFF41618.1 hypothetical protein [Clostridium argentinense]NFP52318.1 hypothetical protein [Clostridium argentinense]NFP74669.1 hypothetical protein [Clostridium argentinense]
MNNVKRIGNAILKQELILNQQHIAEGEKKVFYYKEGSILPLVSEGGLLYLDLGSSSYLRANRVNSVFELM